ncbi:hypothetical protein AM592_00600 [Bacillus gobiensis]|uniref:Uncharacterized protein n=2 Tax=Bacillus TaxID=1386 RepID=A0A0M5JL05_9BACI|nr:hypothetical protein [Bacillus capparidis]ALC80264.1 hypothetical protein AM592_00600 [Bacillus gobiensis]MED1098386.1 hypothetical protein [Bacillus capparidis]
MNIDQSKLTATEKNLLTLMGTGSIMATINHVPNDLKSITVYAEHHHEGKLVDTIDAMTISFDEKYPAPKELKLAYLNFDIEKKSYLKFGILEENGVSSAGPVLISNGFSEHGISGMAQMPQNVEYGEPMLIGFSIRDKGDNLSIESSITNKSKDSLLKYDDAVLYYAKLDK